MPWSDPCRLRLSQVKHYELWKQRAKTSQPPQKPLLPLVSETPRHTVSSFIAQFSKTNDEVGQCELRSSDSQGQEDEGGVQEQGGTEEDRPVWIGDRFYILRPQK